MFKKAGIKKLLSKGDITDKYYGELTEALSEEIAKCTGLTIVK